MKKLMLFIIVFLLIITGCSKKEVSLRSQIKYQEYLIDNSEMIVVINNSSNKYIDIKIEVTYFDKDKTLLGSNNSTLHAVGGNEVVMDLGKIYKDYDNYGIKINAVESAYKNFSNIKINDNDTGNFITIEAINNNNTDVNLNIGAIFYKDNKIVGYDYISDKVKAINVLNTSIYYPNNSIKNIDFDNYKLCINESYKD